LIVLDLLAVFVFQQGPFLNLKIYEKIIKELLLEVLG